MKIIHHITVDAALPFERGTLQFSQGDCNSHELRITLFNNGRRVLLNDRMTSDYDVVTSGTVVAVNESACVDLDGQVIVIQLGASALSVAGKFRLELRVHENNEDICVGVMTGDVRRAVVGADSVPAPELENAVILMLRRIVAENPSAIISAVNAYLDSHSGLEQTSNKFNAFSPQIPTIDDLTREQQEAYYPTLRLLYNRFYEYGVIDSIFDSFTIKANGDLVYTDSDGEEQLIGNIVTDISGKEDKSNKVTAIGAESTDAQYPSALAVYKAVESGGNVMPDYVKTEADRVVGVVANHQGSRTFNIGMISDMHIYSESHPESTATDTYYNYYAARHACQGMARLSRSIHLNAFAMLGDYIGGDNGYGYTEGVMKLNRLASDVRSDREIRLIGNHDYGFRVNQGYDPSFVYPFVTAYNAGMVMGDTVKGYGYYDNEEFKLRVIALNTTEYDGSGAPAAEYNIGNKQKLWFTNALDLSSKSDAAQWQILILSHHPIDWSTSSAAAETDAVGILKAYRSGSTITISSTTVDFANKNAAVIIGNIHGHLHNYLSGTIYGTNYKRWCCPSACFDSTNRYYSIWRESTTYGKTIRSAEDTAFAVFSIDLDAHTVSRIHYGAGYDTINEVYYTPSAGYTNRVPTSIDTDSSIYNVVGYADGYRLGSSGSPTVYSGSVATGYIAAVRGDVIRIKGIAWNTADTGSTHSEKCYLVECNSSFSVIGTYRNDQKTLTKDGDIYTYTVGYSAAAYIRLNGIGSGENLIVTVNEEII